MRNLQIRKRKEQDQNIYAGKPQGVAIMPPRNVNKNARHMDLFEAASQTDIDSLYRKQTPRPNNSHSDLGTGKENMQIPPKRPQREPYQGDATYRQIAYNQYLSQAFGLEHAGGCKPQPAPVERSRRPNMPACRPDSDASAMTTDSMEVNFHMAVQDLEPSISSAKDRRPKIQVQIPGKAPSIKRPTSTAHLVSQINRQKSKGRARQLSTQPSTGISPPSATNANGEIPARLSIVSPLSVMEMPKPRRPFSALSLEDMTKHNNEPEMPKTAPLEKSYSSGSSDDITDHDDRSTTVTRPSSTSSLMSDATTIKKVHRRHSIAFSVADPVMAGVFDATPDVHLMPPRLNPMRSNASLSLNTNKPLPPEPTMEEVHPLRIANQSYSRGSMLHPKRKAPSPLNISRSPSINCLPSRMSSLRSKYTPADLDALDAAFVKSSPQVGTFNHSRESSWEQAQSALEEHLGTITEDESVSDSASLTFDPLQISRGPNDMVPSRQAPPPPCTALNVKLSDGSISSRNRLHKQPSNKHIMMQMRDSNRNSYSSELRKRISAPVGGSMIKANRILGKSGSGTEEATTPRPIAVQMEREASNESNWSSSSPDNSYNGDSSSPKSSNRGDTSTPETDISDIPDAAFEEVKARLELLSPKNDTPSVFKTWGHVEPSTPAGSARHSRQSSADLKICTDFDKLDKSFVPEIKLTPLEEVGEVEAEIGIKLEDLPPPPPRERQGSEQSLRPRSLASIALSEIAHIYGELPTPVTPIEDLSPEEAERMISADAAEQVLLRILENLDNLQDLFATATVSRGFYRTFKRHELPLMKNALYGMSPAAWELREMTPPYPGLEPENSASPRLDYTPTLYLQHYMRDMYTMIALKSMILIHCESFLRADTITALAGGETERASQIDDAFWRVWTFCQIFGCGSNREEDITAQMDWLRGGPLAKKEKSMRNPDSRNNIVFAPRVSFGYGNAGGLSAEDLYDMTEIWTCLGVLVRGFQGKRQEARDHGVFSNAADLTPGDVEAEDAVLEEWTHHLLTLAPPTVLDVTSPTTPTAATFAHARSRGYTTWTPPTVSRATFLKEAVSRIYQERIAEVHPSSAPSSPFKAASAEITTIPSQKQPSADTAAQEALASRWRVARHAAEIRAKRNDPTFKTLPTSEDRPMSNYPSVLQALDATKRDTTADAPPVPALPAKQPRHKPTSSETDTSKHMISALVVPKGPQVRDPVDVAVERLVSMGFEAKKAKRALANTDTGNSVDFEGALEELVRERKRDVEGLMHLGWRGRKSEEEAVVVRDVGGGGEGLMFGGGRRESFVESPVIGRVGLQQGQGERGVGLGLGL